MQLSTRRTPPGTGEAGAETACRGGAVRRPFFALTAFTILAALASAQPVPPPLSPAAPAAEPPAAPQPPAPSSPDRAEILRSLEQSKSELEVLTAQKEQPADPKEVERLRKQVELLQ